MTMLDQILQILSPQKDFEKNRRTSSTSTSSDHKSGKTKKKAKKNDKKPIVEEKKPYLDPELFPAASGPDLAEVIRKPAFVDMKEWVATHTISLFHNINLLYGTVSEFCTTETCRLMQGPCQTQYMWVEERGKKLKCTAPQYIDYVMTFCQKCISNQELFPTKYAQNFSENFTNDIKKMLRFLFHVMSHMYYAHFVRLRELDLHIDLNLVFKHFIYLVREFNLLDKREISSLDDLVEAMGLFSASSGTETTVAPIGFASVRTASPNRLNASTPPTHNLQQHNMASTAGNGAASVGVPSFTRCPTST